MQHSSSNDLIYKTYPFFIGWFLFLFIGMAFLEYYGKNDLHLLINSYYNENWAYFYKYLSIFGQSYSITLVLIYVILKQNWRNLLLIAVSLSLSSLISSFVKKNYFKHIHRPEYYFDQLGIPLHRLPDMKMQIPYTFPSGHTLTAFVIAIFLCTLTKNKLIQSLLITYAILMAFSRMYLHKHFLLDTLGGSVLGTFTFIFCYYIINGIHSPKLDRPILKSFRKSYY